MYVEVEHKATDAMVSRMTFAYNVALQQTAQFTPYKRVYERIPATTLDVVLPNASDEKIFEFTTYTLSAPKKDGTTQNTSLVTMSR